ncbi:MAG: TonB-dependent receptor [Gemmatimonadales bacterium]
MITSGYSRPTALALRIVPLAAVLALGIPGGGARAQQRLATLRGTVVADSTNFPLGAAEVAIPRLLKHVVTDSAGNFILGGVPLGNEIIIVRRIGFASLTTQLHFAAGDTVDVDFVLLPTAQRLAEVKVKGKTTRGKLADFDRRRAEGFGHFFTDSQLVKMTNRLLSEVVNTIPGPQIYRSNTSTAAWVSTARGTQSLAGAFVLDQSDVRRGAPNNQCYAAVFLDGVPVFTGRRGQLLFDINTIPTAQIAGIEYYGGAGSLPPEFNVGGNTCGALVIWTK